MKHLLAAVALVLCTASLIGQSNNRTTAYFELKNFKEDPSNVSALITAKEAIDKATAHEKTIGDEKTWRYAGDIYFALATAQDSSLNELQEGALSQAVESYNKCLSLENKRTPVDEVKSKIIFCANFAANRAIELYNTEDYSDASEDFEFSAVTRQAVNGEFDTLAIYNAGLCAEKAENYDRAISLYRQCLEVNYQGGRMYFDVAKILEMQGQEEEALELLNEGINKFPEDQLLLTSAINIYLKLDKVDEALANLSLAIEREPTNPSYYFARGTLNEKKGDLEAAAEDYLGAIRVDSMHYEANYNMGAMYVNRAGEISEEMNALPFNAQKEYEAKDNERKELYAKAIPYLEAAYRIQPEDEVVISTLMQLYGKVGNNDGYQKMKDALGQ